MQQSWNGQLTREQGARLRELREQGNISRTEVAKFLTDGQYTVTEQEIAAIELSGGPIDAHTLLQLGTLYDKSLHYIFHGSPYKTREEYIQAYLHEEIGEGLLAEGLGVDRLEARIAVEQYQMSLDTAKREVCKP